MAQLVIKGHAERGQEVVGLLEMLGGKNHPIEWDGSTPSYYYYIDNAGFIFGAPSYVNYIGECIPFTLEEFLEKYPYRVGDTIVYTINGEEDIASIEGMSWVDDSVMYKLTTGYDRTVDQLKPFKEESSANSSDNLEVLTISSQFSKGKYIFNIPEGFELDKVENGGIYLKRKEFPRTYKECLDVLNLSDIEIGFKGITKDEEELYEKFIRLIRCRDAYWKLAKGWQPIWVNEMTKYIISFRRGEIYKGVATHSHATLAFPTAEMRDAFLENFKKLILACEHIL